MIFNLRIYVNKKFFSLGFRFFFLSVCGEKNMDMNKDYWNYRNYYYIFLIIGGVIKENR